MRTTSLFRKTATAFAFTAGLGQIQAAPIGERRVIVDQEKLNAMSAEDQSAILELQGRLEAVLATDRSELTGAERKALRAEYREMKREMDAYNAGGTVIYLSTAGIIIILLLLIILL